MLTRRDRFRTLPRILSEMPAGILAPDGDADGWRRKVCCEHMEGGSMLSRRPAPGPGAPGYSRSPGSWRALAQGRALLAAGLWLALCAAGPAAADEEDEAGERELKPIGQVRVRPEFRDNADFDGDRSDRQKFYGMRTRLGLDVKLNPKLAGRILVQDSRYWGVDEPSTISTATEKAATDLYEGYVDLRWIWDLPLDIRLGRQALSYGRERLVGPLDFSNFGRTFDAFRFRFTMGAFVTDVFSAKLVETNAPAPDTTLRYSDRDRNFSGLYISREGERVERADVYWLRDIDKTQPSSPGEIKRHTIGALARVNMPASFAIEGEYAYQTGTAGSPYDIAAQMLTLELLYAREDLQNLKLAGGFDWATGDGDPTDDELGTFSQLFPTSHAHLGYIDYVGRQNIQDFRGQASVTVLKKSTLVGAYHWFRLDEAADAWYNAAGNVNQAGVRDFGPDPARSARHLGSEIDLLFRLVGFIEQAGIEIGYSHFFAGEVVRAGGGPDDDSDWAYLQVKLDI